MAQVKICRVDEILEAEPRQFIVEGTEIMLIKLNDDFYCLAGRCTHAGAPLAEGKLYGDIIECPWHGSRFKVTDGAVIRGPAERQLKTYPLAVKGDNIFVQI